MLQHKLYNGINLEIGRHTLKMPLRIEQVRATLNRFYNAIDAMHINYKIVDYGSRQSYVGIHEFVIVYDIMK